ncbi:MAG: hypothetical protein LBM69_05220, partial [Lachnospiraceae bacterium]|nr:hypothetical protein [Lachnospiraceae bacterium]
TDVYYISNIFQLSSLKIVFESAAILGRKSDEKVYHKKYDALLEKVRFEYFTANGRLCFDTITAQALALYFDVVPTEHRAKLAAELYDNVKRHGYKVATGFIGTPFLLFALADNGYIQAAQKVLMNNAYPGWLYEVDMGATTIWERWNSLETDGNPGPDGMNSYNHYAYGSAMEFVYRRIAGIEQLEIGFKRVRIAPNPCKGLAEIRAEYNSTNGSIVAGYKQKNGKITFFTEIPEGVTAEIVLPNEGKVAEGNGTFEFIRDWEELDVPTFGKDNLLTEICNNPKALKAFSTVFGDIFKEVQNPFSLYPATIEEFAEYLNIAGFDEKLAKANSEFLRFSLYASTQTSGNGSSRIRRTSRPHENSGFGRSQE